MTEIDKLRSNSFASPLNVERYHYTVEDNSSEKCFVFETFFPITVAILPNYTCENTTTEKLSCLKCYPPDIFNYTFEPKTLTI